jgi:predicted nucleic acid-binding protein
MGILLDASAIMAVIAKEAEREVVLEHIRNTIVVSPYIVSCEIANALSKMARRKIMDGADVPKAFRNFEKMPVNTVEIDIVRALEIACAYGIYAYDAFYLECAERLKLPLFTFDSNMSRVGKEIGITILGGKNAGF